MPGKEPITTDDRVSYYNMENKLVVYDVKGHCGACTKCLLNSVTGRCLGTGPYGPDYRLNRAAFRRTS